ncbi:MAG: hypothetical protein R2911_00025 [Caldilineaceae bacterium]
MRTDSLVNADLQLSIWPSPSKTAKSPSTATQTKKPAGNTGSLTMTCLFAAQHVKCGDWDMDRVARIPIPYPLIPYSPGEKVHAITNPLEYHLHNQHRRSGFGLVD